MDFPGSLLTSTEKSGCLLDLNLYILIPSHFQQSNKSLKIRDFFAKYKYTVELEEQM